MTGAFIILDLVTASPGYTQARIQKSVPFKYLKFIVHSLYRCLSKALWGKNPHTISREVSREAAPRGETAFSVKKIQECDRDANVTSQRPLQRFKFLGDAVRIHALCQPHCSCREDGEWDPN